MQDTFVHLRLHTEYSLLDGIVRVDELFDQLAEQHTHAIAMTDHVNLFAWIKFYQAAWVKKIKPIVGADLWLRQTLGKETFITQFTALCQNQEGYHHLIELISQAYLHGQQQGRPTLTWEELVSKSAGLIILSGARHGEIGRALLAKKNGEAEAIAERWKKIFPDRFYIELQRTHRENEETYVHAAVTLAEKLDLPVVATNDVRFLFQDDFQAHETRVCIHEGNILEDPKRPQNYSAEQYLKTTEQMITLFQDIPEAIQNTVEIAKRCNVKLQLGKVFLPQFPIPVQATPETYLKMQSEAGLEKILLKTGLRGGTREDYNARLTIELDVINRMGFAGYFLIVADFIQWAKDQEIPVGPGRGSGAGSVVAYALGITELDPLEHQLLFERFLNPERISMPDFDIDFCMEKRDAVIDYVAERYGRNAVSQIITYGTMAAKAVVRDVGRVLGLPYGFVDKLAKLVPFELGMTLEKALKQEPLLRDRYKQEEEVRTLIDLALKLEGIVRNAGKHAGGVLIAPSKLTDFAPIYCEEGSDHVVSQFDKDDVEAIGLVKFDFLGLRTLTIIDWTVRAINAKRKKENQPLLDITDLPYQDEKTFALLKKCETSAVFQLESRGMKDLIRRLQPDSFEDITPLVALFRPGPLQSGMVDDFIARKHGEAAVEYAHPDLEPILKPTYGVILYQEQVMQIAQVLANYTLGAADILRRAMGKKKPEEMAKQRIIFTQGCQARGIATATATYVFDLMEKFAGYGFNKSHSVAYALLSYRTAWLKAHFPAEFMAAVLSSDMDNTDKVVGFLNECKRMQLKVNPPHVNRSDYAFAVNEKNEIEYGLGAIKGVGENLGKEIAAERKQNGPYQDFADLCCRLPDKKLNKRILEALIKAGALDGLKVDRASMFVSIEKAVRFAEQAFQRENHAQVDLFSGAESSQTTPPFEYIKVPAWNKNEMLEGEKETLGWYLSGHPLEAAEAEFAHWITARSNELGDALAKAITLLGVIVAVKNITTKSGRRMAAVTLEDQYGRVEITVFSDAFEKYRALLQKDQIVLVKGEVSNDDFTGGFRLRAESLMDLATLRSHARRLVLIFSKEKELQQLLPELTRILSPHRSGSVPVVVQYHNQNGSAELALGKEWRVAVSEILLQSLRELLGMKNVVVEY